MARTAALGGLGHGRGDAAAPVAAATPPRSLRRSRQSGDEPASPRRSRPADRGPAELQDEVPWRRGGVLPDPGSEALREEPGGGGNLPLSHTQHGRCATITASAQQGTAADHRGDGTLRRQEGFRSLHRRAGPAAIAGCRISCCPCRGRPGTRGTGAPRGRAWPAGCAGISRAGSTTGPRSSQASMCSVCLRTTSRSVSS